MQDNDDGEYAGRMEHDLSVRVCWHRNLDSFADVTGTMVAMVVSAVSDAHNVAHGEQATLTVVAVTLMDGWSGRR